MNNENNDNKENEIQNPFMRKSVITRSPTTPVMDKAQTNSDSFRVGNVGKLGEKIEKLIEFLKTRSNVHKDIVMMSREIQALYMQMSNELNVADKPVLVAKETQTEEVAGPSSVQLATPKRKRETNVLVTKETQTEEAARPSSVQLATPKRKRETNVLSPKGNKPKKKKDTTLLFQKKIVDITGSIETGVTATVKSDSQTANQDWVKVRPRAKNRRKSVRPDALIIKACGDSTYADILKEVKSKPELNELGQNVKNIRKTEKGELLLELNKPAHQSTCEFRLAVAKVLGKDAEVRALSQEVEIEIRDIDEVTTKKEVYEALINKSEAFRDLQATAIKSLRRAYGGTQTAKISLGATLANQLVQMAKIRIGWVICRIREKLSPRRCFKCLDFGHPAAKCKGHDNSDKCLRCGEPGHKIGTCSNKSSCLLCKSKPNAACDHVTGCTVCPYYKKALHQLRK